MNFLTSGTKSLLCRPVFFSESIVLFYLLSVLQQEVCLLISEYNMYNDNIVRDMVQRKDN